LLHADGRTGGRTDRRTDGHHKLIVAFHNSAEEPKKQSAAYTLKISLLAVVFTLLRCTLCFWCRFCNFQMCIVMNMNAKANNGRKNVVQFILTTSCTDHLAATYQTLEIVFNLNYGLCTAPRHSHIVTC